MAKKKITNTNQQLQGITAGTIPLMPESASVNVEQKKAAETAGLPYTPTLGVKDITPAPKVETAESQFLYKGVDVTKPFSTSDFATPEDYENARRQLKSLTQTSEQYQQQQQQQQILSQLGAVGNISQAELNGLIEQYGLTGRQQFKEGAAGALREAVPSALQTGVMTGLGTALIGSVGSGAAAGAVGGPVGIAIGAGAGIVFGLWKGLNAAKKAEAKEDVTNAMSEFTQLKTGMTQVATLASAGYINSYEAVELYNAQLTRMLQIEAQIKYLQDTNLKDYLSDGSDDLAQIQTYLNQVAPVYAMRIRSALMNPTSKVPYSDIIMQDLQDGTA